MNAKTIALLRHSFLAASLAVAATVPLAAFADSVKLSATLNGAAEVPPNTGVGMGTMAATFDTATNQLSWTLTYSGLTGPATAAHFHGPAAAGANAGVVLPFANPVSPIEGKATLTPAQAADLMGGKWYTNVHTAAHPGGEIRGQVQPTK
ncbi:MAG TPA: CHRD domain-containing protein [Burkholderiaceae bacterium]|jgi:hypothetical protein